MMRTWKMAALVASLFGLGPAIGFTQQSQSPSQSSGIPLWQYTIAGPSNESRTLGQMKTYTGTMVGQNPFSGARGSTTIRVLLIPVRVTFPAIPGTASSYPIPKIVFDPTAPSCVARRSPVDLARKSPLFNNARWVFNGVDVGTTQYVDAIQRANFWKTLQSAGASASYHVLFQLTTLPVVDVTIPPEQGAAYGSGCFGDHAINGGSIRETWFDAHVRTKLLPSLASQGVGPDVLPIFYLDTAAFKLDDQRFAGSAVYAYHQSISTPSGPQFYVVSSFNAGGYTPPANGVPTPDQPLANELVNWVNNPYSTNQTPAWGWIGEYLGCYGLYAPAFPLYIANTYPVALNGFTYTMTEQAFFSWFYDQSPSIAAGGVYSDHGTLTKPASAQGCTFAN